MKTIQIKVSDSDYQRYHLSNLDIKFSDLVEKISTEYARESLLECNRIAEQTGLSKMTLEEINKEIKMSRDAEIDS